MKPRTEEDVCILQVKSQQGLQRLAALLHSAGLKSSEHHLDGLTYPIRTASSRSSAEKVYGINKLHPANQAITKVFTADSNNQCPPPHGKLRLKPES